MPDATMERLEAFLSEEGDEELVQADMAKAESKSETIDVGENDEEHSGCEQVSDEHSASAGDFNGNMKERSDFDETGKQDKDIVDYQDEEIVEFSDGEVVQSRPMDVVGRQEEKNECGVEKKVADQNGVSLDVCMSGQPLSESTSEKRRLQATGVSTRSKKKRKASMNHIPSSSNAQHYENSEEGTVTDGTTTIDVAGAVLAMKRQ